MCNINAGLESRIQELLVKQITFKINTAIKIYNFKTLNTLRIGCCIILKILFWVKNKKLLNY